MKIKDIPKIDRPRERFLEKGPDALSKSELLAILIGSGIKGKNVKQLSEQIVRKFGNKFLDIRSLSGGEKTLTALAFIFAIQEYDPSPFYLLDEVDAALDKRNSELLSKLIQKYAQKAQYVVISHNDSIISEANYIYGVSMQENVSKVVSLKV